MFQSKAVSLVVTWGLREGEGVEGLRGVFPSLSSSALRFRPPSARSRRTIEGGKKKKNVPHVIFISFFRTLSSRMIIVSLAWQWVVCAHRSPTEEGIFFVVNTRF